jgi:hypothetical protein
VKDWNKIFEIETEADFVRIALEVFAFQYENCAIYQKYVDLLGKSAVNHYTEIPFLPIEFFNCNKLTHVTINSVGLQNFPPLVGKLVNLQVLNFCYKERKLYLCLQHENC